MSERIAGSRNLIDQQLRPTHCDGCTGEMPAEEMDRRIAAEQERIARERPDVFEERDVWRKPRK